MRMSIEEMVKDWLQTHGYDGLYWDDGDEGCGCGIDNLAPCGNLCSEAQPAYKQPDGKFGTEKPEVKK